MFSWVENLIIPLPAEWRGRGLRGGVKRNFIPLPTLPTLRGGGQYIFGELL